MSITPKFKQCNKCFCVYHKDEKCPYCNGYLSEFLSFDPGKELKPNVAVVGTFQGFQAFICDRIDDEYYGKVIKKSGSTRFIFEKAIVFLVQRPDQIRGLLNFKTIDVYGAHKIKPNDYDEIKMIEKMRSLQK